eukprot:276140-Rhodomonas_salina.1
MDTRAPAVYPSTRTGYPGTRYNSGHDQARRTPITRTLLPALPPRFSRRTLFACQQFSRWVFHFGMRTCSSHGMLRFIVTCLLLVHITANCTDESASCHVLGYCDEADGVCKCFAGAIGDGLVCDKDAWTVRFNLIMPNGNLLFPRQ